ncbi:MAG: SMC-Scp complex subunit ScpB, partial [Hyphomicrobiales bacterium]|nr:SMC-Scp complex subunit ScpB [Hyphomicrobiales bacterium]
MPNETVRALEAILLVAEEPITTGTLSQILELPKSRAEELCKELAASYEVDSRGFVVVQVAGGSRLQTPPDPAPYVERFVVHGQASRLSAAALETLAIVADKQPISRAQVAAIRGVNVEG